MKKILVIDDEIGVFISIEMALNNCKVIPAYTGAEAIEQFKKERPELILLDLRMPDIDGLDILHIIRRIDNRRTPVIVLTAYPQNLKDVSLDELNIISCFVKPFDLKELTKKINKIWGGKK